MKKTDDFAFQLREIILRQSKRANAGHIGSSLSIADLIAVLYSEVLGPIGPRREPDRDRFVLSKGHAALALYGALYLKGVFDQSILDTYCADGSLLGVHPEHALDGVDFCTGSLGMGFSFAVGAALAAKLSGSKRRIFVLLSDAECNEGVVWEAALFAAHHRLSNLVAILDLNGQQALGYTRDVLDLTSISKKWQAFGWIARDLDGHDRTEIARAISEHNFALGSPAILIAKTIFGKGVSFMENRIPWHYLSLNDEQYAVALRDIGVEP
ncbi:MAG: transketolase [Candidatus Omnitrophica bacterium]|nr:transketolase [Candidatus Omnitrophota bacterium]